MIPEDLRYTAEHEWVVGVEGGTVRVGITHFAQDALGDIVFVQLPDSGAVVAAGESLGEIESTKSVSEIYAPVGGTVTARNEALGDSPEVINSDPYGAGWLVEIAPADPAAVEGLLSADAYRELTES
ncbi:MULTISPECIES: glycine cleavage system protein GcvH [Micromonospora]|uniref:Glycine cleavage system H protein n=1 Tax=Micromonospora rifamycinica TaxID=291594 RepID=A0A109IID0_9ACTN|nr:MULTISPECIES: glycine cleavage system protein GcvH [Micromonospora]KWV31090.1 glycine cleavage system protein H [Micromonospora rifamycinica]WFE67604.1 glycine cleavage system protein GcvH [Micromonospora sp. WMMD714]SCG40772.1 glycine cleavage system H protein [Micromonospora rifamycinica]